MCEATEACTNKPYWLVNARWRTVQSAVCGVHLAGTVRRLSEFNDERYKRRPSDHGVMIYPNPNHTER